MAPEGQLAMHDGFRQCSQMRGKKNMKLFSYSKRICSLASSRSFSITGSDWPVSATPPRESSQLADQVICVSSPVISDALVEQALEGENTALPTFVEARNQFELNYLRKLLQITKGNVTHAARMAGRNRTEFYKLLSRHELDANDFKE